MEFLQRRPPTGSLILLSKVTPQDTRNLIPVDDNMFDDDLEQFINKQCSSYGHRLESEFS